MSNRIKLVQDSKMIHSAPTAKDLKIDGELLNIAVMAKSFEVKYQPNSEDIHTNIDTAVEIFPIKYLRHFFAANASGVDFIKRQDSIL